MNILISDFLFADAHKSVNSNFIDAVSMFADVDVISLNGYYDNQINTFSPKVNILNVSLTPQSGVLAARLFSLKLMGKIAAITKNNTYDAVICLGFETMFFGFGLHGFHGMPMFLMHHKNIDELTNRIKKAFFDTYKNKVYHVVFEEFFKERLVNGLGVSGERVFVVPHPAKPVGNCTTDKFFDCVGLCNSNDEAFISEALARAGEFEENGLHILLRSKSVENQGKTIEIFRGYLEKRHYDELIAAGRTVFVPLPKKYIYRLSGSIYDALSREKFVYTTSRYYAEEYERRYPGTCGYVDSVSQLLDNLIHKENVGRKESFRKFLEDHSIGTVTRELERMIHTVMNEK